MVSNSPQHVEQILLKIKKKKITEVFLFCESTKVARVSSNTLLWPNVSQKKKKERRKVPTYKSATWKSFNSRRNHIKQLLNNEDIKMMPYYEVSFSKQCYIFVSWFITIVFSESLISKQGNFSWRAKSVCCCSTESVLSWWDAHHFL